MSEWHDIGVEYSILLEGALLLLVVQVCYYVVALAYTVWKWLRDGRRVPTTAYRYERRANYRRVWKRAEDYRPQTDPWHANDGQIQ